ncbi:MAG: hypothetical protein ACRDQZ_09270 [Mycobacteriales bacterium]
MNCRRCDHAPAVEFELCTSCWDRIRLMMTGHEWSKARKIVGRRNDGPQFWPFNRLTVWCRQFDRRSAA